MSNSKRITLGSGKLYLIPYAETIPEVETICVDENLLGLIKGGATLEYAPTFYEAKDDLGLVVKTIITEETATLKSGILTFNGNTLEKLCDTGRVTEDKIKQLRTIKIGGIDNAKGDKYIICFHHADPIDGDIWVVIVGQNQAGFSLAFAKDAETVIDAEFKCLSQDAEGTLIKYIEKDLSLKTT
jgi:hypothetical protein